MYIFNENRYCNICCLLFLFCYSINVAAQNKQLYLDNPCTGISSYDYRIRNKVTNTDKSEFVTFSSYIYLSDVLRENCFTNRGLLDEEQLYENIKGYFDSIINYRLNRRHDIKIFPDYNGSQPCKNSSVINSNLTDDGKLLINFPITLYRILSKQKYPPIIIKAIFPEKYKVTKNIALLDFRNSTVQSIYEAVLKEFSKYLQGIVDSPNLQSSSNAKTKVHKRDFISRIKMAYIGPWGEGITYIYGKNANSAAFIKIAEMYKTYLPDKWLIAPSYGMRTNTTTNENYIEFEYYLLTTKYGSLKKQKGYFTGDKEFGLFVDHIGMDDCDRDFSLCYNGIPFRPIAMQKYKSSPLIGENTGSLKSEEKLLPKQIKEFGFSLCNVWINSYSQIADSIQYPVWKENSIYFGYRFYITNNNTSIKDGRLNLFFLMGNSSYSPLYDDFWLPQIVIRDKDEKELRVIDIDKDLNLRQIPCKKSPLNYEVMVNTKKQVGNVPDGVKVYFRVIDKCHINENMYLDNDGRTGKGEYLLLKL